MTEKPLVSVIINCYNGEKFLREAIDSVIAQTYENWELVFWDNQSTDSTREIVESYKNPKIKYFYAPKHTPLGEARNLAVEKANGEYINFLDADDVWSVNKLEEQVLRIVPAEVEVIYTPFELLIGENESPNKKMHNHYLYLQSHQLLEGDLFPALLLENYIIFSSVLFPRRFFVSLGGLNTQFQLYEDWELLLKMALRTQFAVAECTTTYYRIHSNNTTTKYGLLGLSEMRDILTALPDSKEVTMAIQRNETRYAAHVFLVKGRIIKGLKYTYERGSFLFLTQYMWNVIKEKIR